MCTTTKIPVLITCIADCTWRWWPVAGQFKTPQDIVSSVYRLANTMKKLWRLVVKHASSGLGMIASWVDTKTTKIPDETNGRTLLYQWRRAMKIITCHMNEYKTMFFFYFMTRDQPNSREKMRDFTVEFIKCAKFYRKFTEGVWEIHGPYSRYFEVLC